MPTLLDVKAGTQEGSFSLQMVQNWVQQHQDFSLTYYVIADNFSQTHVDIIGTTGLPTEGSVVFGATCMKLSAKATDSVVHFITGVWTQIWEVLVEFSTMTRDPNNQAPEVHWGGELDKEVLEFDLFTGAKPTTTAGEPIFMERPVSYPILSIRRQEPYPFDPNVTVLFSGRVNLTSFWGFPPGTCMMMPILVDEDTQNNIRVCWVTYEIKIKVMWNIDGTMMANTWQARPLNQGYQIRQTKGGKPIINKDKNNHPVRVNLDADGLELKNSSGTDLGIFGSPPISLNRLEGVYDHASSPVAAVTGDIGSIMIISTVGSGGFNVGSYLVSDVAKIGASGPFWMLNGDPGTVGSIGATWELQRAPIYLYFNRAYPAEFNALTLGPF